MAGRLPAWFRKKMPAPGVMADMRRLMSGLRLHTICESAICPNQGDCFSRRTATFLLLGDICTRRCTFCAVAKGIPSAVDQREPANLVEAVVELGLRHVVITSVTRDDLPDGGAGHFATVIRQLREADPGLAIEVLIPDFAGDFKSVEIVVAAAPNVVNHNLETVPRLYAEVRPGADYRRSVAILGRAKELDAKIVTKSGIMVGLGETGDEILRVMADLREVDCDLLTIGQYLAPSSRHHPVVRYVPPDELDEFERVGYQMGFRGVVAAPLVRSSFQAGRLFDRATAGSV